MTPSHLAIARCAFCRWKAQLSGDDDRDVAASLRKILLAHVRYDHPEQQGGYVVYCPLDLTEGDADD